MYKKENDKVNAVFFFDKKHENPVRNPGIGKRTVGRPDLPAPS